MGAWTGALGWECGDGSMGGCDCGDGSVGTGEWERERGNGRVRNKRWDRSVGME